MQPIYYFLKLIKHRIDFKDLVLLYSRAFEMNKQQTYREIEFLRWMDEMYNACI